MENLINIGIIVTYVMVAFAALATIGFGVKKMLQNAENAKKTIYTIVGLIAILIIAYLFASDATVGYEKYETTAKTSKQVGMGLITFYFLIFSAVIAVVYSELSNVFSK
jgi:NADH:ubiquinone oxidoreductase subunit 6 (subunit J)